MEFDVRSLTAQSDQSAAPAVRLLTPKGAATTRSAGSATPEMAARAFLGDHGLSQLKLARITSSAGITVVEFDQMAGSYPLYEGRVKVMLGAGGEVAGAAVAGLSPLSLEPEEPRLSDSDAAVAALRAVGVRQVALSRIQPVAGMEAFANPLGSRFSPILVSPVAFPMDSRTARLSWRVIAEVGDGQWYETVVDAGAGRILFTHNLYRSAGVARIWRQSPLKGDRELAQIPDAWLPASVQVTTGNNVDAYLDINGDDQPDALTDTGLRSGRAFHPNLVFDFPAPALPAGGDPRTFRPAAATNAFFVANLAHDYFYGLGFDEGAGNFQTDNGDRGGVGGDAVLVEVHDRFTLNSANISITPEGVPPRMQLGIIPFGAGGVGDDRDFAYDGQTIVHEYAHGVANRLIGGGTSTTCLIGVQSSALDEGWADYFASSYYNDPIQSAYITSSPNGIRRASYEGYTFTYEDLGNDGFLRHNDGEIWAAALWDLRKTLGAALTDRLVLNGFRLTPCRPTFVDARDAILAADRAANNGANRLAIFTVFARHGLGASAGGFDGNRETFTVFNAAFDLPPDLRPGNRAPVVTSRPMGFATSGEVFRYPIEASDPDGGTLLYELAQGPPGMTVDSATGVVRWIPTFASQRAKIVITDGQGGRVIHGIRITVITPLRPGIPAAISERTGAGLATITVPEGAPVLQATLRDGTGDADMLLIDPLGALNLDPRTGQPETVSVGLPRPGVWIISVLAFTPFENVQLTASLPTPRVLTGNETIQGLNGQRSSETFYRLPVPVGTIGFEVSVVGGSGDVDVVIARRIPPVCQVFEEFVSARCFFDSNFGSFAFGNREAINVPSPQAGDWFINLTSAASYSGATLTTRMTVRPTLTVTANALTFEALAAATAAPAAQTVRIADPSGSAFAWTATRSAAATWLRVDRTSGSGDATLSISVDPAGLVAGNYTGTITVMAGGLGSSPQIITVTLRVVTPPGIAVSPANLTFQGAPGTNPPVQRLSIANTGTGTLSWTATAATASGGNWLSVDQPRGTGNVTLQVIATAGSLAPGVYEGSITIAATGATPVTVPVRYTIAVPFAVVEASLRSVASQRLGYPVSPGEMLLVEGTNFTGDCSLDPAADVPCPVAREYPLPTILGGVRVTVNGADAPMVLVLPTQVRFVIPFGVTGPEARIVVIRQGSPAPAIVREVQAQNIGVFAVNGGDSGPGHIYHADGTLVTAAAPLVAGETFTVLTGGLGVVDPPVADGAAGPTDPLAKVAGPLRAYLGGVECVIVSAHLTPGLAGFYHVQIVAPETLTTPFPVLLLQSDVSSSNEVTAGAP